MPADEPRDARCSASAVAADSPLRNAVYSGVWQCRKRRMARRLPPRRLRAWAPPALGASYPRPPQRSRNPRLDGQCKREATWRTAPYHGTCRRLAGGLLVPHLGSCIAQATPSFPEVAQIQNPLQPPPPPEEAHPIPTRHVHAIWRRGRHGLTDAAAASAARVPPADAVNRILLEVALCLRRWC